MPRYLVERTFPDGLAIPATEEGATICLTVVGANTEDLVTWVHSYVTDDKRKTFCIYDGPSEVHRMVIARGLLKQLGAASARG